VIAVPADTGVAQAHSAADAVEDAVRDALGDADVIVHVEPRAAEGGLRERATAAALTVPDVREVHNVRVIHTDDGYELSLHAKLPGELDLEDAHAVINQLEAAIQAAVPQLKLVHTHIEPLAATDWAVRPAGGEVEQQRAVIDDVVRHYTGAPPERVSFRDAERGRIALVTIALPPEQPLGSAHQRAGDIEEAVRERCPQLVDIVVHTEPATDRAAQG
jgi:divalent metal cation (Fe/Co/Zn/Cd) transporter